MSTIENATPDVGKRVLNSDELDLVNGGFSANPSDIYAFNPQPDPPGMRWLGY